MAENRVIGNGPDIPWHLPEDFKWFKKTTMGHILVMGRTTFDSIGRPLPGRETFVLSRQGGAIEGVKVIASLEELPEPKEERRIFIAGGAQVYRLALPQCGELLMTHVFGKPEGDILFPSFEEDFKEDRVLKETDAFRIVRYVRKEPA